MRRLTEDSAVPLRGGVITAVEKPVLEFGRFSRMKNLRNEHPGLSQRKGMKRQHATADGNNTVLSLYQFRKAAYGAERHLYAQMSDGDVLEASAEPPSVSTGAFGSQVFDGSANQVPASWATLKDVLLFANGRDRHQIFPGDSAPVSGFWTHTGSPGDVPTGGRDFTVEVTDEDASTAAVLDALASTDVVFVRTMVPANRLMLTVSQANANTAALTVKYRKSDGTWADASNLSDGTAASGKSLSQSGTISWTKPTDEIPKYCFGAPGFWYRLSWSAALSSTVRVSEARYTAPWQPIQNVWDGVPQYGVEVRVEGNNNWDTYAAGAVDLDNLAAGKKIYVAFTDPVEGIYIDPGATPNAAGTTLTSLKYWDGSSWQSVGTVNDGTSGMSRAGWLTFPRKPAQPRQFDTSQFLAYWYEIVWGSAISADTVVAIQGMPFFDIGDLGNGYCVAAWKDRAVYSFDRYGSYIYVSAKDSPMILNGADFGILQAGDGRRNRIVAMQKFYNELLVWQEELGEEGGCITLFEGYSPSTFGKIVLSSRIGAMNAKSVAVVDGVLTATATDETIKTLAFCLSRYGVCAIDGRTVSIISDDIQNYFDPARPECIRRGYEDQMWLQHDATANVLRLGLVSGAQATAPNVFPVYDLVTKTWSFDTPAVPISCMTNVEPGSSGASPLVQVGGGHHNGRIYLLNTGQDDDGEPIESELGIVLNYRGQIIALQRLVVRGKAQDRGSIKLEIYENDVMRAAKILPMEAEQPGEGYRRHYFNLNVVGQAIELVFKNATADEEMFLLDAGFRVSLWEER